MVVTSNNANLGTSVVPDLMRVYESLTQSKKQQATQHDVQSNLATTANTSYSQQQHSTSPTNTSQSSQYRSNPDLQTVISLPPSNPILPQEPSGFQTSAVPSQGAATSTKSRPRRSASRKRPADEDKSDSSNPKPRKKKVGDGRWSKRFAWPDELHRDFVSAVFDVGLKHSSPSSILEQMFPHEQITTERIKSHLQKYRLHRQKSKKEFMSSYESSLLKMKSVETDLTDPLSLNCGEVAAHLAYSTITEKEVAGVDPSSLVQGGILQLPQLTEDEKRSPVGASLGYLMGLFFSLKQQLHAQRGTQDNVVEGPAIIPSASPYPSAVPLQQPASSSSTVQSGTQSHATVSVDRCDPNFQSYNAHAQNQHIPSSVSATSDQSFVSSSQHQQQSFFQSHSQNPSTSVSSSTAQNKSGSTTSAPLAASMPPPDARNNPMEESNMMKRDMQSQMEFQTKMRKLKEQELSKYTQSTDASYEPYSETPNAASTGGTASLGIDADFWKSDQVLDEQLFEFLMND